MDLETYLQNKYEAFAKQLAHSLAKDRSLVLLLQGQDPELLRSTANFIFESELKTLEHPDLHIISSETESISVDLVRSTNQRLSRTTTSHKRHCVLVDMAEHLTIAATNAMLKVLEEPNGLCFTILLTQNSQKILPTITSRCFKVNLPTLTANELMHTITNDRLAALAMSLMPKNSLPEIALLKKWYAGEFPEMLAEVYTPKQQLKMIFGMLALEPNSYSYKLHAELITLAKQLDHVGMNSKLILLRAHTLWHQFKIRINHV